MYNYLKSYSTLLYVSDPRSADFFLMSSPFPVLGIIIFYIYFIRSLGPHLMYNQKPFKLDKILILYNAVQVVLNAYLVKEVCSIYHSFNSILNDLKLLVCKTNVQNLFEGN